MTTRDTIEPAPPAYAVAEPLTRPHRRNRGSRPKRAESDDKEGKPYQSAVGSGM